MLVDYFIVNIKKYCQRTFVPGGHVEADKTIIQCYGIGCPFDDAGLLMYLALECKPNNAGKIQNHVDVASGIMLCLKVVRSANKEKAIVADAIANDDNTTAANKAGKGT